MISHKSPISSVSTWNNKYVATAGYDNQVILWSAKTKQPINRARHNHLANYCTFSSSGKYLITTSSDHTARLWEVPTLKLISVYSSQQDDVEMAIIDEVRELVFTASRDSFVYVYKLSGELISKFKGHKSDVSCISWSEADQVLVSSGDDGTIRFWKIGQCDPIKTLELDGIQTDTFVITNDSTVLAGNDKGEIISIHNNKISKQLVHSVGIKKLIFNNEFSLLVSLSYDRTFRVYEVGAGGQLNFVHEDYLPSIVWPRSCAFLGQNTLVFGTFGDCYAEYDLLKNQWDISHINETHGFNAVLENENNLYTVGDAGEVHKNGSLYKTFSGLCNFLLPFENLIISGGQEGKVFEAHSGQLIYQHFSPINCGATFIKDDLPHFIIGSYTGEGLVFVRESSGNIKHVKNIVLHENAIKGLACNANVIFSVCATGAAAFHKIQDGNLVNFLPSAHEKIANGCDVLEDGRFVSVSRDLKIRIWNSDGTSQIFETPHTYSIKCVRAAKEVPLIATGSYEGTISIFNFQTKKWIDSFRPTTHGISSISLKGHNRFIASSYDGHLFEWEGAQL